MENYIIGLVLILVIRQGSVMLSLCMSDLLRKSISGYDGAIKENKVASILA